MSVEANPYAPPRADVSDASPVVEHAEEIRQKYLQHEAQVRSIALLHWLSGAFLLLFGAVMVVGVLNLGPGARFVNVLMFVTIFGGFGITSIAIGNGIIKFRRWARIGSILVAIIGLPRFPFGTVTSGYVLYLLLSAKGRRLFEPDYREIVDATTHIDYRTPTLRLTVAGLLVLLALAWYAEL